MKILAVDTATDNQSVAILDGTAVLACSDESARGSHGKLLVPTIDRLLAACGLALADLEGLAVSLGPGSFTGLRVGLATMLGFRTVTGLPLAAVPTLEALAWNHRLVGRTLCPMLRARTGEVYWAFYRWDSAEALTKVSEEAVGSLQTFAESITGPVIVLGEGWSANEESLLARFTERGVSVEPAPAQTMAASAVSVGLAGVSRLVRGERAGKGVAPRYVQRAEAELVWERRGPAASATGRR